MDNQEETDKSLERYTIPKLNQKEIENTNRTINSTKIESVFLKLPASKSPGSGGEFYQTFREELSSILKLFQKIAEEGTLLDSFNEAFIILIPKTRQKYHTHTQNCRPISVMNIDAKILNKMLANWLQQYIKGIIHNGEVGFIPGMQ